jgi:hypothetical protein
MSDPTLEEQQLAAAIKTINDTGERAFGKETWEASVGALSKRTAEAGLNPVDVLRSAAREADPAGALYREGINSLIQQGDSDDTAARQYHLIREKQRLEYRTMKGRVR